MTKKRTLQTVCILISALTVLPCINACGGSQTQDPGKETVGKTGTEPGSLQEQETEDLWGHASVKDSLPEGLDYDGRTLRFFIENSSDQNRYIGGDETRAGDIVQDALLRRNRSVEDRLNVHVLFEAHPECNGDTFYEDTSRLFLAGDNTYDVFSSYQYALTKLMNTGGLAAAEDLSDLDLSKPWWWENYMDALTMRDDLHFFLIGDLSLFSLSWTRVLFYNKTLYERESDDADTLYSTVFDGNWTLERMASVSKDFYRDLNNNGVTDLEDQLGFLAWFAGASVDGFVYAADIDYYVKNRDGTVSLNLLNEKAAEHLERITSFYNQEGSYYEQDFETDAKLCDAFKEGRTLFLGNAGFLYADFLRDMKDEYGLLPYPKMDDTQSDYVTVPAEDSCPFAINGFSRNLDMAGAILEALCAETYRSVVPVWYEDALKVKYVRDESSRKMLDLISDSKRCNFIYAFTGMLDGLGFKFRSVVSGQHPYVSYMEAIADKAEDDIQKLYDLFMQQ